jgi:hypothetical protein
MAVLKFNLDDLRCVIEHARTATSFGPHFGAETHEPLVLLVKDETMYLMSNGLPHDLVDGAVEDPSTVSFVAYATGYDPRRGNRSAIWEKCQDAVVGDGFAEPAPIKALAETLANRKIRAMSLKAVR